jgi:hypothetical protein
MGGDPRLLAEPGKRSRSSVGHPAGRLLAAVVASGLMATFGAGVVTAASSQPPDFTLVQDRVLLGSFGGYGGQFNQHVYAKISGPPPDLPGFETKLLGLGPRFARVFFNTNEWLFPDRMQSFIRTVELAQRAQTRINVTWQGSTYAFAAANMDRFAEVLADLLRNRGIGSLWVTLFNEPNSTGLTLAQYEQTYRLLDVELRERGVRDRVHFMGGDLVGTVSPLNQSQEDWIRYMAAHMGDLLEAWSIHVFWDFWDTDKIDRRLLREVLAVYATIPDEQRRPLYVTEFGVRGIRTFEGEPASDPGFWPDGTPLTGATAAAFEEGWFMVRAAQLGYTAASTWDLYNAKYDAGTQDYSAIGPGTSGWPLRPLYHLMQLVTLTTEPGSDVIEIDRAPAANPAQLLTAFVSPAKNVTILGLDTDGALSPSTNTPVAYRVGGLPPNSLFRLIAWNADGLGTNIEIGYLDTGAAGAVDFAVPLGAIFDLTNQPIPVSATR